MSNAYILSAARTPIGSLLGSLKDVPAPQLGAVAIQAALGRAGVDAKQVDEVIMGNVLQAGVGQAPARQAALHAGIPSSVAAVTINKVCGSGLKSVMLAAQATKLEDAHVVVAGGMENMTRAPFMSFDMRTGRKLGDVSLIDGMVYDGLTCSLKHCHMGNHAEHIARKFDISREEQDRFSAQSQSRAVQAIADGAFQEEIAPVTVSTRKGDIVVDTDEGPRAGTTPEVLAKLRPVFEKEGSVTAGNASTISDGAAAVVVASESSAGQFDTPWRAKIVSYATAGTEPEDLFYAPVLAIKQVLDKASMSVSDIDLFEINEAFASQMLCAVKELQLDESKLNIFGGGISLGHPIGASGTRTLVTLLHALKAKSKKRGLVSLCLGGGNAVAMVVELE